jgi:hypothetical protein
MAMGMRIPVKHSTYAELAVYESNSLAYEYVYVVANGIFYEWLTRL